MPLIHKYIVSTVVSVLRPVLPLALPLTRTLSLSLALALGMFAAMPAVSDSSSSDLSDSSNSGGSTISDPNPKSSRTSRTEHIQSEIWTITAGSTLKATLEGWGRIPDQAWSVIWDHSSDYRFRTSATFYGPFEDVIGRLVDVIHSDHPELSVTLYRGNHVIHVAESR